MIEMRKVIWFDRRDDKEWNEMNEILFLDEFLMLWEFCEVLNVWGLVLKVVGSVSFWVWFWYL